MSNTKLDTAGTILAYTIVVLLLLAVYGAAVWLFYGTTVGLINNHIIPRKPVTWWDIVWPTVGAMFVFAPITARGKK